MTTNRMGLEQESRLSDEMLNEIAVFASNMVIPPSHQQIESMARELMAYRKASKEPVAFSLRFRNIDGVLNRHINTNTTFSDREKAEKYGIGWRYITQEDGSIKWTRDTSQDPEIVPLYAATPLQVVTVPDEIVIDGNASFGMNGDMQNKSYGIGWNACRAAMLKGTTK